VTVCGTFQFAAVKVRLFVERRPSATLLLASGIATAAVGWLVSDTSKVAVPPASVVTSPAVGVTVIPATSSSVLVTGTSFGLRPL
jgi:hypothetical protein